MRENCFSSSDSGLLLVGATLPRFSSVGRCRRLGVEPACAAVDGDCEETLRVEKDAGRICGVSGVATTETGFNGHWWLLLSSLHGVAVG